MKPRGPGNIGHLPKCYNILDSEGNYSYIVEDQLELIERKGNIALKKLAEYKRLSRKERLGMGEYVFSMALRIPKYWERYSYMVESGEIYKLSNDRIKFSDLPSTLPMDSIPRVIHAGLLLLRMEWSLLVAPEGKHFITSDNPVVVKDLKNPDKPCGFNSSGYIEVTFPVNRDMCLLGRWARFRRIIEHITAEEVDEINFETFKHSKDHLYSSTSEIHKAIILVNHLVNEGMIK